MPKVPRPIALSSLVTASLAVGVAFSAQRLRTHSRPPDIVLIVIDTLRADHLPFYGYARDTAPFLSRLAERGVVFDRAYSTSGWTAPATASLFTSLYPFQHGVLRGLGTMRSTRQVGPSAVRANRVPQAIETIPEALKRGGYGTYGVSDNIYVSPALGFDQGFDSFESTAGSSAERVNKWIRRWARDVRRDAPSFLYVHYMDPHEPYLPKGPWFEEFMADRAECSGRRDWVAAYDSEIRLIDKKIEGLFHALSWKENTLLVVTADHGEEFWDHGHGGHGHTLYGELLNVPLLVYEGGGYGAKRVGEPVSLIDVLPTLREVAGLPPDARNEGRSLVPLLREGRWQAGDRSLFSYMIEFGGDAVWRATVRGGWKLIRRPTGPRLFDIRDDPRETTDRSGERSATAREMEAVGLAFERSSRKYFEEGPVPFDARTLERLTALGYVH